MSFPRNFVFQAGVDRIDETAGGSIKIPNQEYTVEIKLNQSERLEPQSLAEDFRANLRTIQRDLNECVAYLPLEKTDGRYQIDPTLLGKLSTKDIERFAARAGVRGLLPSLTDSFLRDLFDGRKRVPALR